MTTTPEKRVERLDKEIEALKIKLAEKCNERAAAINEIIAAAEQDLRELKAQFRPVHTSTSGKRGVAKGTPNHNARRFTAEQVKEMRKLYKAGTSQAELSRTYGVPQPTISLIVRRKTYADVK
jgi:acyl-CoA reductase-like NAD-dependent aldehyde dehydrogenase